MTVDASRARVTAHTIHVELSLSDANGVVERVICLELPVAAADDLARLLANSVELAAQLRDITRRG